MQVVLRITQPRTAALRCARLRPLFRLIFAVHHLSRGPPVGLNVGTTADTQHNAPAQPMQLIALTCHCRVVNVYVTRDSDLRTAAALVTLRRTLRISYLLTPTSLTFSYGLKLNKLTGKRVL